MVSMAMCVMAKSWILQCLMTDPNFPVKNYLKYTEIERNLAVRYTGPTVVLFNNEYRCCQAARQFACRTDAPHLSILIPWDNTLKNQTAWYSGSSHGNSRRWSTWPSSKEMCLQHTNKGVCSFGTCCKHDHCCDTCGSCDNPGWDHWCLSQQQCRMSETQPVQLRTHHSNLPIKL